MFHFIRVNLFQDKSILVNPATINRVEAHIDKEDQPFSRIVFSSADHVIVKEDIDQVEQLIRKAAFLPEEMFSDQVDMDHYKMIIPPVDLKPVAEMTQEQLDELSDEFIGQGDTFSNLQTLFGFMVSEGYTLRDVDRLVQKVRNWGYSFDTAV